MASIIPKRRTSGVTVALADRQPVVLDRLGAYLESRGVEIVASTADGPAAREAIERLQPVAAILDPDLPGAGGVELAAALRETAPRTAVIVHAAVGCRQQLVDALAAGARGVLAREAPLRDALRAIEMVCDGRYFVSIRSLGLLDENLRMSRISRLTRRERDLLRLVVNGVRSSDLWRDPGSSRDLGRELTRAVAKLDAERIRLVQFREIPNAANGA